MAQHNKTFYPYDPLPAQDLNDIVGFMNGIATGVNMEPESIGPDTLAQSARSQAKVGIIPRSVFGSTGHKTITDIGINPGLEIKLVKFTVLPTPNSANGSGGTGAMDADGNQFATYSVAGTNTLRNSTEDRCIIYLSTSTSYLMSASYVSVGEDSFTVNVHDASSTFDVAYEVHAS